MIMLMITSNRLQTMHSRTCDVRSQVAMFVRNTCILRLAKCNHNIARFLAVMKEMMIDVIKGPKSWWITKSITTSRVVNQIIWIDLPRVEEL